MERMNEYIKDRTKAFDDLFPCGRPKFDQKQSYMALNQKLIKNQKSSIISLIVMKYHYLREYWRIEKNL